MSLEVINRKDRMHTTSVFQLATSFDSGRLSLESNSSRQLLLMVLGYHLSLNMHVFELLICRWECSLSAGSQIQVKRGKGGGGAAEPDILSSFSPVYQITHSFSPGEI